jgi:hypothetical protein
LKKLFLKIITVATKTPYNKQLRANKKGVGTSCRLPKSLAANVRTSYPTPSIHIFHLAPVARFGSGRFVGIAKTYAESQFVAFTEAQLLEDRQTSVVVGKEAHRTTEADRAYAH